MILSQVSDYLRTHRRVALRDLAIGLWERMRAASSGKRQAEWLSTHPADTTRIADIRRWLPEAMQYYKPR